MGVIVPEGLKRNVLKIGNQVILREQPVLKKKKKTQPSKCEDLTGFIKGFMTWAASHLASRGELPRATERERFLKAG